MTRAVARTWRPIVLAAFVACVWLNQGGDDRDWGAFQNRVAAAPMANIADTLRYPFAYLYIRASDVRLYYELSNMILGRPADSEFLLNKRGQLPAAFAREPPAADGKWHVPYVEVPLEYPVMALPFILGPRLVVSNYRDFGVVFGMLMGLCLVGAIVASLDAARVAGVNANGLRTRAWLASGLLLAQGAIAVQRLDAVTALWIALALRAAVHRKTGAFGIWSGLATATKIVPALMLPALLAADARTWCSPRRIAGFVLGFFAALAVGLGPMIAFSPHALGSVISYHAMRGLQCESTLGLLLATIRLATGTRSSSTLSFGSYNLDGPAADALGSICGPLSIAAMLGLGWLAWRGAMNSPHGPEEESGGGRVARATVASLIVLWLTGKVFSPQYLTWGLAVVLAVPGAFGMRLGWLLVAAMALTQFYMCGHYELVFQGRALGLLNLGVRQAILAYAGYLVIRSVGRGAPARERGAALLETVPLTQ